MEKYTKSTEKIQELLEEEQDRRSKPWPGDLDFDFYINYCVFEAFFRAV